VFDRHESVPALLGVTPPRGKPGRIINMSSAENLIPWRFVASKHGLVSESLQWN
jgi:hypothetical protein